MARESDRPGAGHPAHAAAHDHGHHHHHHGHHSTSEVWRSFEEHPLTHSMAHYLMAIAELREEHGYARITDVARRLGVTKGSASIALKAMRDKGYVTEDENRMLLLTPAGRSAVASITGSRAEFLRFFHEVLGVEEHTALEDACKLEHLVSPITTERLRAFLDWVMTPCEGSVCGGRALLEKFGRPQASAENDEEATTEDGMRERNGSSDATNAPAAPTRPRRNGRKSG